MDDQSDLFDESEESEIPDKKFSEEMIDENKQEINPKRETNMKSQIESSSESDSGIFS